MKKYSLKSKWKRWIAAFDSHGNLQNDWITERFFEFLEIWKPHKRYHGGDLYNFAPLRGKATQSEKCEDMDEDFKAGTAFFDRLRPHAWVLGNHDQRLWDLQHNAYGDIRMLASQLVDSIEHKAKKAGCEILPYDARLGVISIGNFRLVHGFYTGKYAAARHVAAFNNCFFGHVHSFSEFANENIEPAKAVGIGCMCEIDQDYNRAMPAKLKHKNGWLYGIVNEDTGQVHYWTAQKDGDNLIIPSDVVVL